MAVDKAGPKKWAEQNATALDHVTVSANHRLSLLLGRDDPFPMTADAELA